MAQRLAEPVSAAVPGVPSVDHHRAPRPSVRTEIPDTGHRLGGENDCTGVYFVRRVADAVDGRRLR